MVDISSVASLDAVLRSLNMLRVGGHPVMASRMAAPVEVVNSLQALEDEHEAHLVATVGADGEVRVPPIPSSPPHRLRRPWCVVHLTDDTVHGAYSIACPAPTIRAPEAGQLRNIPCSSTPARGSSHRQ